MKKPTLLYTITLIIATAILNYGCDNKYKGASYDVSVNNSTLKFSQIGGDQSLAISTGNPWQITGTGLVEQENGSGKAEWFTLDKVSDNRGGYVTVTVYRNDTGEKRTASLRLTTITNNVTITIEQEGDEETQE